MDTKNKQIVNTTEDALNLSDLLANGDNLHLVSKEDLRLSIKFLAQHYRVHKKVLHQYRIDESLASTKVENLEKNIVEKTHEIAMFKEDGASLRRRLEKSNWQLITANELIKVHNVYLKLVHKLVDMEE